MEDWVRKGWHQFNSFVSCGIFIDNALSRFFFTHYSAKASLRAHHSNIPSFQLH